MMTSNTKVLLIIFVILAFSVFLLIADQPSDIFQPAQIGPGTIYYVDGQLPSDCPGNYSITYRNCSGTNGYAYNTVQEGINQATGGSDTVAIRAGEYRELYDDPKPTEPDRNEASFYISSAQNGMTLKAYNNEHVVLTYDPNNYPYRNLFNISIPPYDWQPAALDPWGPNVYYLTADGGDPGILINKNTTSVAEGFGPREIMKQGVAPLGKGEWSSGTMYGYTTVFVRLSNDANPDDMPDGYVVRRLIHGPIILIKAGATEIHIEDLTIVGYKNEGRPFHEFIEVGIAAEGIPQGSGTIYVDNCDVYDNLHAALKGGVIWKVTNCKLHDSGVPSVSHTDRSIDDQGYLDPTDNSHAIYINTNGKNNVNGGYLKYNYMYNIGETDNPYQTVKGITLRSDHLCNYGYPSMCICRDFEYSSTSYNDIPSGWKFHNNIIHMSNLDSFQHGTDTGHHGLKVGGYNSEVYNNVISASYSSTKNGAGLYFLKCGSHTNDFQNNIIWGFKYNLIYDGSAGHNSGTEAITHDYNCVEDVVDNHRRDYRWGAFEAEDHGFYGDDPKFISSSPSNWTDFQLSPNSPLLNKGNTLNDTYKMALDPTDTTWPPTLIDQNENGYGWEMGAFAYQEGPSVNNPPVLSPIGNRTVTKGSVLTFTISATDPNGDTLTYSASNLPSGASFNPSTRTFSWAPAANQLGSHSEVYFEVSDGELTDSETITITVTEDTPSSGLALYYDMETLTGGELKDLSGKGNNGTIYGATPTLDKDSNLNKAYSFDGLNDYVNCGDPTDEDLDFSNGDFSVSAWIYANDPNNTQFIIDKKGFGSAAALGYLLRISGGYLEWLVGDGSNGIGATAAVSVNQWQLVTGVIDRGSSKAYLYKNAVLQDTEAMSGIGSVSNSRLLIIGSKGGGARFFNGKIDDVRIYNKALSQAEIQALFQGADTTPPAAPIGVGVE